MNCTTMNAMCKAGLVAMCVRLDFGEALHPQWLVSTGSLGLAVQIVGKAGPNSNIFAGLPAFHFMWDRFSKTGMGFIHASSLFSDRLSTFPPLTVTTTNKEYIFKAFHSSRDLCCSRGDVSHRESTETTRLRFSCGFGVV
jgi:hypothetical protein